MVTLAEKLRQKSEVGLRDRLRSEAVARRLVLNKQREANLAEADKRIKEAEDPDGIIARATLRGEREAVVCVLRGGGIHFSVEFDRKQSPKFLGIIGKMIRRHFVLQGLKVSFCYWEDGMRMREFPSDSGYQLVVSW